MSGLVVSKASAHLVQPQPPAGACHASSTTAFSLPDPGCTPGALNPAVTQATIGSTVCRSGYTSTIRPSETITEPEKIASLRAYGDPDNPSAYEYDHLVSLELGGAANDPRNLWPEPQGSPNPKDSLENRLKADVCNGAISLASAQRLIATNWISGYRTYIGQPAATPAATRAPAPPPPAAGPASSACTATMSNTSPARGGDETVTVHTTASATVDTAEHYKTTTSEHDGAANSAGGAVITFNIGHPSADYTVQVDVTTSSGQSCSTSFTPS